MTRSRSAPGEFELIARYFAPLTRRTPGAFNLSDDAALYRPRRGADLVITADAIVEGVHFLPTDPPGSVAQKLLRVNLSDLAAKGARPKAYTLITAWPRGVSEAWVAAFAKGLAQDQRRFGVQLLGGDTVVAPAAAQFSATLFGEIKRGTLLRRGGARVGDTLWVTGTIGDGGLGLRAAQVPIEDIPVSANRYLVQRYRTPEPRLAFGLGLGKLAHAAMDVSDGLLQDLGKLAAASGLAAELDLARVPLSTPAKKLHSLGHYAPERAIVAGDDYEILFTAPRTSAPALLALAKRTRTQITPIGHLAKGKGVIVRGADPQLLAALPQGYDHFRR